MKTDTIQRFEQYQQAGKIKSLSGVARAIGMSATTLSLYLSGKYTGKVKEVEKKVSSYLNLMEERALTTEKNIWVQGIGNSENVLGIARLTHVQNTMGLIIGRAGLGKSFALTKYAQQNKDAIYIEVDTAFSSKELMSEISKILGFNGVGHLAKLKNDIIAKLKGTGRLLIIDQAEYLPERALDLLRTIHDKAGVGVLLAGLPKLLENIKGIGGIHEQIYTRIGAALELKPLSNDDIKKLIQNYIPNSNGLHKEFIAPSRRNARVLSILSRESKRIASVKNSTVDAIAITKANNQLLK